MEISEIKKESRLTIATLKEFKQVSRNSGKEH